MSMLVMRVRDETGHFNKTNNNILIVHNNFIITYTRLANQPSPEVKNLFSSRLIWFANDNENLFNRAFFHFVFICV